MGTFERARQRLGFTPSTAVRAPNMPFDVGTGGALGQLLIGGLTLGQNIYKKRQQMQDANSDVTATKLRQTADQEFETFKLTNPQETWEPFRIEQTERVAEDINKLTFSPDALILQQSKSEFYSATRNARALTEATRQLRDDTIEAQTNALIEDFASGDPVRIAEGTRRFADNGDNMGKDKAEVLSDIQIAEKAGAKIATDKLVDGVYAAIEAGTFEAARAIAQDPAIPERTQAQLRTSISSAERAVLQQAQEQAGIDIVTKYWDNKLTDLELDAAAEAGLISAADLDKWKKRVREPAALITDPAANAQAMQAVIDASRGVKTFAEASSEIQSIANKLNATDGKARIADLQKGFAQAQSEKVNEWIKNGSAIMSPRFRDILGFEAMLAKLSFEEKNEEKRRFDAETRLRELYTISLNQWFTSESRRRTEPIPLKEITDFALRLRNSYQERSRGVEVEALEESVRRETTKQIGVLRTKPEPLLTPSDIPPIPTTEIGKAAEIKQLENELKRRGR